MKQKTSITLDADVLRWVDESVGPDENRSAYIERVLRRHFRKLEKRERDRLEIEALNRLADRLNIEMAEVLEFQTLWPRDEGDERNAPG